jgi:hypothetical protein
MSQQAEGARRYPCRSQTHDGGDHDTYIALSGRHGPRPVTIRFGWHIGNHIPIIADASPLGKPIYHFAATNDGQSTSSAGHEVVVARDTACSTQRGH